MKTTTAPSLTRPQQIAEAENLVKYFDALVEGKDDKARIVGVSEKASPGSPRQIFARTGKARDWTLLPERRKQQNERAVNDIREKLTRARSNPLLMAIPNVERAVNIMHKELNAHAELYAGHLKSAVRIFSSEARAQVAEKVAESLRDEEHALRLEEEKHGEAVRSRNGNPADRLFDRPDGRPSVFDELRARLGFVNEQKRAAEKTSMAGQAPKSGAQSVAAGIVELDRISHVAHAYKDTEKVAKDTKNSAALDKLSRDPRTREDLTLSKMIEKSLAKNGVPLDSQSVSIAGAKLVQALTRFDMVTKAIFNHGPAEINGKEFTAPQQLKSACQEALNALPKEIATLSKIARAFAELSTDQSLTGSQRRTLKTMADGYADLVRQMEDKDGPYQKVLDLAKAGTEAPEKTSDLVRDYALRYERAKGA